MPPIPSQVKMAETRGNVCCVNSWSSPSVGPYNPRHIPWNNKTQNNEVCFHSGITGAYFHTRDPIFKWVAKTWDHMTYYQIVAQIIHPSPEMITKSWCRGTLYKKGRNAIKHERNELHGVNPQCPVHKKSQLYVGSAKVRGWIKSSTE